MCVHIDGVAAAVLPLPVLSPTHSLSLLKAINGHQPLHRERERTGKINALHPTYTFLSVAYSMKHQCDVGVYQQIFFTVYSCRELSE